MLFRSQDRGDGSRCRSEKWCSEKGCSEKGCSRGDPIVDVGRMDDTCLPFHRVGREVGDGVECCVVPTLQCADHLRTVEARHTLEESAERHPSLDQHHAVGEVFRADETTRDQPCLHGSVVVAFDQVHVTVAAPDGDPRCSTHAHLSGEALAACFGDHTPDGCGAGGVLGGQSHTRTSAVPVSDLRVSAGNPQDTVLSGRYRVKSSVVPPAGEERVMLRRMTISGRLNLLIGVPLVALALAVGVGAVAVQRANSGGADSASVAAARVVLAEAGRPPASLLLAWADANSISTLAEIGRAHV